jgi:hypothetical protein
MGKQKLLNFIILLFILSFVYQGCNIKQPTAPSWDVSFNLPIAKKYYTLSDIIEKKSDLIKNYTSGTNKDILYYSNVNTIDEIKIKNQLKVDGTSQTVSNTLGIFSIKDDSINASLGYSWLDPTLQAGMVAPIPNASNLQINNTDFTLANQFSSVTINSGLLNISIVNYFPYPVNLTLNSLSIINKSNGSVIYHTTPNKIIPYLTTVALDAYQFPSNTLVENNLQFVGNVSINGNNTVITLPSYSIKLTAKFSNLELSQAVANIPEQDVQVNGNITFDNGAAQPTKIQRIVIDSGTLSGSVTNNSNVDALATITLKNFIKPTGDTLKILSLPIPPNKTINVFSNLSLQGYSLINPIATNLISYNVSIKTIGTSDYRSVISSDNFTGNFSIGTLFLREFTGQLKPTTVDPTRSSVSFDVKDIENKIQFQQINLNSTNIQIKLHVNSIQPGTLFKFGIDQNVSWIKAKNKTESFSLPLNSTTLDKTTITQSDSILTLNSTSMSDFFKQFKHLPDSIIVNVGGVLNPDYGTVSLTNQNNISGSSNIELPFYVGILGGQVADSVTIDLSQDDRNKIKDLNSIAAGINITNGIPVALSFRGRLYDENNKFLMNFPPKHSDQDTVINIAGAITDNTGNVTTKINTTNKISLVSNQTVSETTLLSKAKYMRVYLKISTTRSNNQPVIFKTTNDLNITVYGSTDYQVKP